MKNILKYLSLILFVNLLFACSGESPDKVLQRATLNANNASTAYRPIYFREIMEQKSRGILNESAEEYIKSRTIKTIDEAIEKVKSLKKTTDNTDLIDASLSYLEASQQVFEKDYLDIARMIDKGAPGEEVEIAIDQLFERTESSLLDKQEKLTSASKAYAEKHNIDFRVM